MIHKQYIMIYFFVYAFLPLTLTTQQTLVHSPNLLYLLSGIAELSPEHSTWRTKCGLQHSHSCGLGR